MVTEKRKLHSIVFVICAILFAVSLLLSYGIEKNTCMGVQLMESEELSAMTEAQTPHQTILLYNGNPAAIDRETCTVYISQQHKDAVEYSQLKGNLTTKSGDVTLKIIKEDVLGNIAEGMGENCSYRLVVIGAGNEYTIYNIVFTSLPVINIEGVVIGTHENGGELYEGGIYFWDPASAETGEYRTVDSAVSWHVRGNSSTIYKKKSLKLSLKNSKGENNNLSFCGLGEDDDWILNPMSFDDVKTREKLVQDLWKSMSQDNPYNADMTTSEYVEVVENGEYKGLYLIMRRVDEKYLKLDSDSILLKGSKYTLREIDAYTFGIKYSPFSEEETRIWLEQNFVDQYVNHINVDNYIDISLMSQLGSMGDNITSKNYFVVIEDIDTEYHVTLVLWDTDLSFGVCAVDQVGFVPRFEETVKMTYQRIEQPQMIQLYPDLDKKTAERWQQLRQTVFTEENLLNANSEYRNVITESGALARNEAKWGFKYRGGDTLEQMEAFIKERLKVLDEYYSQFI